MYFQLPPTPTPFISDSSIPELTVPDSWIWNSASETVGVWNSANSSGFLTTVQMFTVAIMVIIFIGMLLAIIRRLGSN